ncbi:MAG: YceI family protein [Pseudoxanthomonas sp.]
MNCLPSFGLATLLALAASPVLAASADYELDPVHTRVMVAVQHAGFSKAIGTVSGSSGRLRFDPDDWSNAVLQVSVPVQRLDFGDGKWNKAVLAKNLLDGTQFPAITFVSSRIEPVSPQRASVVGMLTLHGVTREVKLDVVLNALKRHPLPPFRRTAGFSATTVISRAAFGISAWKSVIGDAVEIHLEVEATRVTGSDMESTSDNAGADNSNNAPSLPSDPAQPESLQPEPLQNDPAKEPATP